MFFLCVSEEILLLRSPRAPCGYAARANSEGAKFEFAFVKLAYTLPAGKLHSIFTPVDPIYGPAKIHSILVLRLEL